MGWCIMVTFNSIWVSIPDYPDYMVSPEGNFLSINYKGSGKSKVLKTGNSRGYSTITLYKNKTPLTIRAHKIVATIFCIKDAKHTEVNHKNGDKKNNHFSNLEWVTSSENQIHAYKVLKIKSVRGEKHGISKLTDKDVYSIIDMINNKIKYPIIAKKFKISTATVCNIKKGIVWKHLTKGLINV